MQKVIIGLAPNMTVEVTSESVKDLIRQAAFWTDLPTVCPLCGSSLVLYHRDPQDNDYWGQACTGPVTHEANFGVNKNEEKGLYYKGEWQDAFGPYQRNGQQPRPQSGQQQPYQANDMTGRQQAPAPQGNPVAQTLGDMVTAKQLEMIRAIAREIKMDEQYECKRLMNCGVEDLSKRAASDFIEHLQTVQRTGIKVAPAPAAAPNTGTAPVSSHPNGGLPDSATHSVAAPIAATTAPVAAAVTQPVAQAIGHTAPAQHGPECLCPQCEIPF